MKVLMFKNDSCGACKMLEMQLPRLEFLLGEKVEVVNLSNTPEKMMEEVKSLPTMVLITEGGSVRTFSGWGQADVIYQQLVG